MYRLCFKIGMLTGGQASSLASFLKATGTLALQCPLKLQPGRLRSPLKLQPGRLRSSLLLNCNRDGCALLLNYNRDGCAPVSPPSRKLWPIPLWRARAAADVDRQASGDHARSAPGVDQSHLLRSDWRSRDIESRTYCLTGRDKHRCRYGYSR